MLTFPISEFFQTNALWPEPAQGFSGVTYQIHKIGIFITQNRLTSELKHEPRPLILQVEKHLLPRHQRLLLSNHK
jgi:hypothetical protein